MSRSIGSIHTQFGASGEAGAVQNFEVYVECAPRTGQIFELGLTGSGLSGGEGRCRDATAGRLRRMELKRQVVLEYNAGETLHGLSKRHDVCRNPIRVWIAKSVAGEVDDEVAAAEVLVRYEARIASLERLVGQPVVSHMWWELPGCVLRAR